MENYLKRISELQRVADSLIQACHPLESVQVKNIVMRDCAKILADQVTYLKELLK